ncbi:MAG: transglutaminase family protein [Patescibacteria group bacterium]|nr:transglutaminase family protein [Patescibacteria group bacterium]
MALLLLLSFPNLILAQTEFKTDYTVDYTVNINGLTHAKLNISLTNQLSNIYAKEFTLSIGSTKLSNISISTPQGVLEPNLVEGNKTTNITIPFKDKVLGKDKSQTFTLEFDSADFSHRLGSVWEISIPRLSKTDNLNSYQLTLSVPNSFGQPATISPAPISTNFVGNATVYRFKPEDLFQKGIAATFGHIQYYDFSLQYHLNNPNLYPIKTEIALPPDTPFQTILYQTLDPQPLIITKDQDGNWLAEYQLASKQTLNISATGSAEIYLKPKSNYPQDILDPNINYLSEKKYWETTNPKIIKLAEELKTPQKIYQYVVDNLIYDYGRLSENITRFGAANALDNPTSAVCMEFTDLFIALARANKIPARAVNGFAYTTNSSLRPLSLKKDVLHAWPEYYDAEKNLWIPVDPTWGNTTGGVDFFNQNDLNHFAFVFQGQDSQYPIPAGAYKTSDQQTKDVNVIFGKPLLHQLQTSLTFDLPKNFLAGVSLKGNLILKNTGNVALYNQTVSLTATAIHLNQKNWTIAFLPPFSQTVIPFEIQATGWSQTFTDILEAKSELSSTQHPLTITPAYYLVISHPKFKLYLLLVVLFILSLTVLKLFYERFSAPKPH